MHGHVTMQRHPPRWFHQLGELSGTSRMKRGIPQLGLSSEIAHFSRRRRTYIRVPKTDPWYLGFQVSAIPTDRHGLESTRNSARHAPQTASVVSWPCPTPTASSASFRARGPWHPADLPTSIFGDGHGFRDPQKCAAGALSSRENEEKNKGRKNEGNETSVENMASKAYHESRKIYN